MNRTRVGGQYADVDLKKKAEAIPLPKNVHHKQFAQSLRVFNCEDVLSNAEVAIALSEVEELNHANSGGAGKGLSSTDDNVYELTRAYVTAFSGTRDPTFKKEEVRALKLKLQEQAFVRFNEDEDMSEAEPAVLEPFEIALLCDLRLQTVDEVQKLIPSIQKRFDEDEIQKMLDTIDSAAARM